MIMEFEKPDVEFVDEDGNPLSDEELENQMKGFLDDLFNEYDELED